MRLLLFLLLGTLIFGVAFPAFILIAVLVLLILAAVAIFGLLTGIFGGKNVIIYKNGRRVDNFGKKSSGRHTANDPEVITGRGYSENGDADDFGEHAEPEIVELPSSALSKDEDKEQDT